MKLKDNNINFDKTGSRLTALDLTRFFAMFMMMQGHVIFALASPDAIDMNQPFWQVWNFMRGITAPIFLFVSGAVHIFANKRMSNGKLSKETIKKRIKTSLMVIGIGYLLVFPVSKVYDLLYLTEGSWRIFFQVNVLQMFGVSLLLLLLHYIVTRNEKQLGIASLITAIFIILISPYIHTIAWFNYLPEPFAAYLTSDHGSVFPIFPFTAYLFLGSAFGAWLKTVPQENRTDFLLKKAWLIGVPLVAIGFPIMYNIHIFHFPHIDVMRVNPGLFLIRTGAVLIILSLMTLLYTHTKGLTKYYSLFGKRALYIYVIHLFMIYGTPLFPGFYKFYRSTLSLNEAALCAGIIVVSTLLITYLYDRSMHKFEKAPVLFKYVATAYLLYVFFI